MPREDLEETWLTWLQPQKEDRREKSDRIEPLEWNNSTLITGDVTEEVSRLKRQPGKDVLDFGSGALVNTLMRHELIDEYRLMVFPVVVGSGKRLLREGIETTALKLVETKTFSAPSGSFELR
jgi:dihydrofolate reductase